MIRKVTFPLQISDLKHASAVPYHPPNLRMEVQSLKTLCHSLARVPHLNRELIRAVELVQCVDRLLIHQHCSVGYCRRLVAKS
jgi:hypothetical protein